MNWFSRLRITTTLLIVLGVGLCVRSGEGDEGEEISFSARDVERVGLMNSDYWVLNNERSTSKDYTLWEDTDVHFIEWPGNVTLRDPEWPLLKWNKPRAKLVVGRCVELIEGTEMRAYAYRYLFLTWGPHRLQMGYSPPLTVPADLFRNHSRGINYYSYKENRTHLIADDFAFVHDTLLVAMEEEGVILRVYDLRLTYTRDMSEELLSPVKYSIAKGITSPVNKLVTQHCCSKDDKGFCLYGQVVVAYREYSSDFRIFISYDGGEIFIPFSPHKLPSLSKSSFLHAVFSYPELGKVLILHGSESWATLDSYSMSNGGLISSSPPPTKRLNGITGMLQGSRIGEEMSLIIWDKCSVWYSLGEGMNVTKALFYVHGYIRQGLTGLTWPKGQKHYILKSYCKFGANSTLAVSNWGKLAILDEDNNFHLALDMKTTRTRFRMVALHVDMSLILRKHRTSIVPYFDHINNPKLLYPPRYLEVPDKRLLLVKDYSKRLGMRLLPKTVFPSEFITVFYQENALLPKKFKNFALQPCQTSSLSINGSITQKAKYYTMGVDHGDGATFTVRFKSKSDADGQLHYEPINVNDFLHLEMRQVSVEGDGKGGGEQYWLNYEITIKSKSLGRISSTTIRTIFLINFYTSKDFRCLVQPSNPVYIKIDGDAASRRNHPLPLLNEDEMARTSFLKPDNVQIEYGRSHKIHLQDSSCACSSGTCSSKNKKEEESGEGDKDKHSRAAYLKEALQNMKM